MKRMNSKKWLLIVFFGTLGVCTVIAFTNWLIDPLWMFNHKVIIGNYKILLNDRQQKTHFIVFNKTRIDTILIGSSRTANINIDLYGENAFNYSLTGMMPTEYSPFAASVLLREQKPNRVIIGLDFFGSNKLKESSEYTQNSIKEIKKINTWANNSLYKLVSLNFIAFLESLKSIKRSEGVYYDGISIPVFPPMELKSDFDYKKYWFNHQLKQYDKDYREYIYNDGFLSYIKGLYKISPQTNCIFFTTPVGTPFWRLIEQYGRWPDYERWIRETANITGGFWNFMYVNSVSSNSELYAEPSHFGPQVSIWIADRIEARGNPPEDFGVYVTPDNVEEHLKNVRRGLDKLIKSRDSWDEIIDNSEY